MKHLFLVSGYKKTGKDTFIYDLMRDNFMTRHWIILSKGKMFPRFWFNIFDKFSFASTLKLDCERLYGIPHNIHDSEKDIKQFKHPITSEIVSARDIWKEEAAKNRDIDVNFYCKLDTDHNVIVSDWRYENEYEYNKDKFTTTTIRLFRDIPIPDMNDMSEHSLDHFEADFLLVDTFENIKLAKKIFPQYKEYYNVGCFDR